MQFLRTRMQLFQDTINVEEEIAIGAHGNSMKSKSQFQWFFIVTVNRVGISFPNAGQHLARMLSTSN
jgi:hypothetical protein